MAFDMPDLFDGKNHSGSERRILTVSQVTDGIKKLCNDNFADIWVEGEISNFRPSSSGHWYFSLKDTNALLGAVMFARSAKDVAFKLEDGLKVVCFGSIDVYAPRGTYQLIVGRMEPKGVGGLQLALEQLKKKLQAEGLFDVDRKRPIPYLPSRIGIVTSATGAAVKDMLKVLDRRFKDVHIIINSVKVQGEGAREEISGAIMDFNEYNRRLPQAEKIGVLIVGRGGGSIEDLWAFNEEIVARAIYGSDIPVISAVGHERDWTIADLVADVRAATPSVAAELVLPKKEDLTQRLDGLSSRMAAALAGFVADSSGALHDILHRMKTGAQHRWEVSRQRLYAGRESLERANPAQAIPEYRRRLADMARQMFVRIEHAIQLKMSRLGVSAEKLGSLNPLNILARGYSVTFLLPGRTIVKDAARLKPGDALETTVASGTIRSTVTEVSAGKAQ
jgi:exodeoxyribonuclease VII large subunit